MSLKLSSARWLGLVALTLSGQVFSAELTLNQAIEQALEQDLWQTSSVQREQALIDRAQSSGSLPDPSVTLTAGNFPVDTFDIQQEPMTQLSVAVTQMFPRGDSPGSRFKSQASGYPPLAAGLSGAGKHQADGAGA